jgi:murein DD-endopeptidase MepM/ murein hydrolase activator NlpD
MRRRRLGLLAAALVAVAAACGGVGADEPVVASPEGASLGTTTTLPATTTTTAPPTTTTTVPPRVARLQAWEPFADAGGLVLHHPSALIERIGLHESNHDGAQVLAPRPSAVAPVQLETRDRGTAAGTAADIVVQPGTEVRAPVTGTVVRSGEYVLYCRHTDEYLVIEPDDRPGWEVKLLHVSGLLVARGGRVEAGVTPVAAQARQLPFESQVDELRTVDPAWPHVHLEVVDPSIPDRPTPGGGCTP